MHISFCELINSFYAWEVLAKPENYQVSWNQLNIQLYFYQIVGGYNFFAFNYW